MVCENPCPPKRARRLLVEDLVKLLNPQWADPKKEDLLDQGAGRQHWPDAEPSGCWSGSAPQANRSKELPLLVVWTLLKQVPRKDPGIGLLKSGREHLDRVPSRGTPASPLLNHEPFGSRHLWRPKGLSRESPLVHPPLGGRQARARPCFRAE